MMSASPNQYRPRRLRRASLVAAAALLLLAVSAPAPLRGDAGNPDRSAGIAPLEIETRLDRHACLVADPVRLNIEVRAAEGIAVEFPVLADRLGQLEITDNRQLGDLPDGDRRLWQRQIRLESLVPGEFQIPALEIGYVDHRSAEPVSGFRMTAPQTLTVHSTLEGAGDPAEFRDIKSVVFLPEPRQSGQPWLVWAAGTFFAGLAVATVVVARRRRRQPGPRQAALQALRDLRDSEAFRTQDGPRVWSMLTRILRNFMQGEFEITAPRMTTQEFLAALQDDSRLSAATRQYLAQWMISADMVKFAGLIPDAAELESVVHEMEQLIQSAEADEQQETN